MHYAHSQHSDSLLHPLLHPQIFVLDVGTCDALPVAPGPSSAAQIFELRRSQVDLAWRTFPAFDRMPVPSIWAFQCRLHWAPLVPRSILCVVGLKTDRLGWGGRQPHERGLRFLHHQTDTGIGPVLSWVVYWQRSKSSGQQVLWVAEKMDSSRQVVPPILKHSG